MQSASAQSSSIARFLFTELDIRGAFVCLDDVWQTLQQRRQWSQPVTSLMGELVGVAAVIAGNLKQPGRITLQIQGSGPLSLAVVDCTQELHLRALARSAISTARDANASALIGDGRLQLTLDAPSMREPWTSLVALEGRNTADIFRHYLSRSEQQPTGLWLAADENRAAALFLQTLPDAHQRDADGWRRVHALANTVSSAELLQHDAPALLRRLFSEETLRLFDARPLRAAAAPPREKFIALLRSLGEQEARAILAEQGQIRIEDELANHAECFDAADVDAIFRPD